MVELLDVLKTLSVGLLGFIASSPIFQLVAFMFLTVFIFNLCEDLR